MEGDDMDERERLNLARKAENVWKDEWEKTGKRFAIVYNSQEEETMVRVIERKSIPPFSGIILELLDPVVNGTRIVFGGESWKATVEKDFGDITIFKIYLRPYTPQQ